MLVYCTCSGCVGPDVATSGGETGISVTRPVAAPAGPAGPAGSCMPGPVKMHPVDTEKPCAAGASGVRPKPAGMRGEAGIDAAPLHRPDASYHFEACVRAGCLSETEHRLQP